ncbi:hypothetical protein [Marinicella meishanensis]|uniref:hypothetical protein n=1 Tax=Marinicella meishanensis TaxID=2873263 RepID=UPI001CBD599C|nr:hypothetical protein [Marinicella sp. NBU2979]
MNQKEKSKQRIAKLEAFGFWAEFVLPTMVKNVINIESSYPHDTNNPVLRFLIPLSMRHVVENTLLSLFDAWTILNKELKNNPFTTLEDLKDDYSKISIMRSKLVAHKEENSIGTDKYEKWYSENFGSYESVLIFLKDFASDLAEKLDDLPIDENISVSISLTETITNVSVSDFEEFISALKEKNIY